MTLLERRTVRDNVFIVDNKILVLGGNNSLNGEYLELDKFNKGFQYIQSYGILLLILSI